MSNIDLINAKISLCSYGVKFVGNEVSGYMSTYPWRGMD